MHAAWTKSHRLAVLALRKHVRRYEFATFIGALHKARWREGERSKGEMYILGPSFPGMCIIRHDR